MEEIGKALKFAREEANKSVYEIEKELKINHQSLYNWEKGKQEPSIKQCIKLAQYYGITLNELVGIEENKQKTYIKNSFNTFTNSKNIKFK